MALLELEVVEGLLMMNALEEWGKLNRTEGYSRHF